ncbi:hypothetical protein ZPAH1_orf00296 [Aeromonas phage ZPAH1]|nr:hypothetical protein ASwh1_248 [Aeromonas phage Aswh_1]QQG34058.1 hypothetical protein ZPAH1_orf00296 [Aeromonas phage ZPAH1]
MKLIYIGSNYGGFKQNQIHNFRVRRELTNFLEKNFDKIENEDVLMKVEMKETIYWDFCPYDMDVGNGKMTFVWDLDKEILSDFIHHRAQEI